METALNVKNLSVKYGESSVLSNISFEVMKGDYIGLAGPNGAGKTTLVKAILGLIKKSEGEISIYGKRIENFKDWEKIGYLPQKNTSFNRLFPATVKEVIKMGLLSNKQRPKRFTKEDGNKVNEILETLKITDLKNKMISKLSGGQTQRVFLARAFVGNPELLILDEPSTALDPETRKDFFDFVQNLNETKKTTIILITHDTGHIGHHANKILYIDKTVIFFGKFEDFHKSSATGALFKDYAHPITCSKN
jgi:zinc transport system ATP-binding protein